MKPKPPQVPLPGLERASQSMARKITAGRRRLEMKKIEKETALQVTFSKRRAGVFKKASELAILCGAEVVIVVFSPAGRPYTFGSPDVDTITHRFLGGNPTRPAADGGARGVMLRQKVREYTDMVAARDMKQARLHELKKTVKDSRVLDVESLEAEELSPVLASMLELRGRLASHLDHLHYLSSQNAAVVRDEYYPHHNPAQLGRPTMVPYVIGDGSGVPVAHPRQLHATSINPVLGYYGGGPEGVVLGHHHRHGDAMAPAVATAFSMGFFNGASH